MVKGKYKYLIRWLNDELADVFDTTAQKLNEKWSKVYVGVKFFATFWPIAAGVLYTAFLPDIAKATNLFFKIAFDHPLQLFDFKIHWLVSSFWVVSIIWFVGFFAVFVIDDRRTNRKFDKIKMAIVRAPNAKAYLSARSSFDGIVAFIQDFKALKEDFRNGDFTKIDSLAVVLSAVSLSILKLASQFFDTTTIIGANFMIYFELEGGDETAITNNLNKTVKLYFRPEFKNRLKGILYLVPDLIINTSKQSRIIPPLILPIYDPPEGIYNASDEGSIIPGATLAFRKGTSMVGDTHDIKKYYNDFTQVTKDDIKGFFFSDLGKEVRSFASFKIQHPADPYGCIGIFNLDSDISYSFGLDEEFFDTFYSMIYPILALISPYILYYKEYMLSQSTKPSKT